MAGTHDGLITVNLCGFSYWHVSATDGYEVRTDSLDEYSMHLRSSSCGRKMGKLRFGSLSERSTMHRHASQHTSSLGRRLRVRSGAGLIGFLWMLGYVSVVLGALFSTFFFPDILSMLRSQRSSMQSHMLYQVFLEDPNLVPAIS